MGEWQRAGQRVGGWGSGRGWGREWLVEAGGWETPKCGTLDVWIRLKHLRLSDPGSKDTHYPQTDRPRDKQTDQGTDRHTEEHTGIKGRTDRQRDTHRQTKDTHRHTEGQTDLGTDRPRDRHTDRGTDTQTKGQTDRGTDRQPREGQTTDGRTNGIQELTHEWTDTIQGKRRKRAEDKQTDLN